MKPVTFPEQMAILAKDQSEYRPLPVCVTGDGEVISCWRPSWWERFRLLFGSRLWLHQMTFGQPVQPQFLQVEYPFERVKEEPMRPRD